MANSLLTGVSGLRVHQQMLDVVGNNLANTNTPGFKSQRTRFSDLLYQTISQATSSTATTGGTNPVQPGLGVRTAAIDSNLQQGGIETTGGSLDWAVQGNGFFIVNDGVRDLYTRAGAFSVDQKGFLIDSGSGHRVQRYGTIGDGGSTILGFQEAGNKNIKIPFGTGIPGQATQSISFKGNLSSSLLGPLAQTLTSATPLKSGGVEATSGTFLTDLDSNSVDYVVGDNIKIIGSTNSGALVNVLLPVDGTTTVGDLITTINANFPGSTATLNAQGTIQIQDDTTGASKLNIGISDGTTAQTGITLWSNHAFALTTAGKNGDAVTTAIQVFDSQGSGHNLSISMIKQANNTWDMEASLNSADGTMVDNHVTGIIFNDDGSYRQVTGTGDGDSLITIQFSGLAIPQTLNFAIGSTNGFDGLTQFGGSSSGAATSQDGFAAGFLSSVSVGQDGIMNGVFTNGKTLPLAQVALGSFANPAGLNREGGNLFSLSNQSGDPLVGGALTGGRGSIQQGALESSNVDVAQEFTRLIVAQRGFQVNARTITVSDQVLQELATIIR